MAPLTGAMSAGFFGVPLFPNKPQDFVVIAPLSLAEPPPPPRLPSPLPFEDESTSFTCVPPRHATILGAVAPRVTEEERPADALRAILPPLRPCWEGGTEDPRPSRLEDEAELRLARRCALASWRATSLAFCSARSRVSSAVASARTSDKVSSISTCRVRSVFKKYSRNWSKHLNREAGT